MTPIPMASTAQVSRLLLLASITAVASGAVYLAIGLGFVPDDFESPPRPVMLLAGVVYLGGSVALHKVSPRLLVIGAAANAVVLLLFVVSAARGTATVDALSVGGKVAQVALSVLLLWAWQRIREAR
jgi:hypothetical protein